MDDEVKRIVDGLKRILAEFEGDSTSDTRRWSLAGYIAHLGNRLNSIYYDKLFPERRKG
jgi:hypothetical protein